MLEPDGPSIAALLIVRYWRGILLALVIVWLWDNPKWLSMTLFVGGMIVVVVGTMMARADIARQQAEAARRSAEAQREAENQREMDQAVADAKRDLLATIRRFSAQGVHAPSETIRAEQQIGNTNSTDETLQPPRNFDGLPS